MKKIAFISFLLMMLYQQINAQCTNCDITNPGNLSNYTYPSNTKVCYTTGTSSVINSVSFGEGGSICIGTDATLKIETANGSSVANSVFTIDVYGTLEFTSNYNFQSNITINIHSGATFKAGNLQFHGASSHFVNNGTFNTGNLETVSGKTIVIENNGSMTVTGNMNFAQGTVQCKNEGTLVVSSNYSTSSTSVYVNCGTYTGQFNLGGGKVINTGTFNTSQIDMGGFSAKFINYGKVNLTGNLNMGGAGSEFFNQHVVDASNGTIQSDGNLRGPDVGMGYFILKDKANMNNGTIGPNLNFTDIDFGASTTKTDIFNNSLTVKPSVTFGATAPTSTPVTVCTNPDGSPSTPVPTSNSECAGVNLSTLQPSYSNVTYEWWTGTSSSRTSQVTTSSTPGLSCYTTVGTVYLWAKDAATEQYSAAGAGVTINDCALAWRSTTDGNWSDTNIWQYLDDSNKWIPIASPPYNNAKVYISNNTTVTVSSNLTINADSLIIEKDGILTVNSGTTLNVNSPLVFNIDADGNAGQLIGACNGSTSNVTMGSSSKLIARRTLSDKWDFISFPFEVSSGSIFFAGTSTPAVWGNLNQSGTNVDFFAAEYSGANRAADASLVSPTNSKYFVSVNPHTFEATKGYIITGGKQDIPKTIDFVSSTGAQLDFCDINKTANAYDATGTCNDGWNLVGTPYPADFNLKYAISLAPYYIYGTNSYSTLASGTTYRFKPFSAYFLQVFGTSNATLTYDNTGLTDFTSGGGGGAPAYRPEDIVIEISDGSLSDNTLIRLQENATEGFDTNMDGMKFLNSNTAIPQIYTEAVGACSGLAVNTLPESIEMVDLKIRTGKTGTYTIKISDKSQLNKVEKIILSDTETGISTDLLSADGYNYYSNQTGTSSRFKVLLSTENANGIIQAKNDGIFAIVQGTHVIVKGITEVSKVSIYDAVGKLIQRNNSVINGEKLELNQQGVYLMEISNDNQRARIKVLISQKN